jgi:hypothetical protein
MRFCPIVVIVAPTRATVDHILLNGAEVEVGRIYAWRIVAAVQNVHSVRYSVMDVLHDPPMGTHALGVAPSIELTVAIRMSGRSPLPAVGIGSGYIHLGPEALQWIDISWFYFRRSGVPAFAPPSIMRPT